MNNLTNTNNSPGFKGDKLDVIASIFEKRSGLIFDECLADDGFKRIVIDSSDELAEKIAIKLDVYMYGLEIVKFGVVK